jgi:uncharacterized protein
MNQDQWESICKKCGKCCYEKVDLGAGEIHYTDEPCQHLDVETCRCKVYHNRHEVEPDCISLTEHLVRSLNWLPEDCAYVAYIKHIDTLTEVRKATSRKKRNGNAKRRR